MQCRVNLPFHPIGWPLTISVIIKDRGNGIKSPRAFCGCDATTLAILCVCKMVHKINGTENGTYTHKMVPNEFSRDYSLCSFL